MKVSVSDPSRTILDMMIDPKLGGGIRSTTESSPDFIATSIL